MPCGARLVCSLGRDTFGRDEQSPARYAKANKQKPSGIAAKETIIRTHLVPALGDRELDRIGTEDVQRLKARLTHRAPKTVNNILTVLNTLLKTAVTWDVIDRMPCTVKLVRTTQGVARFHDFSDYERLVEAAKNDGPASYVLVLLGGDAGLRCGEMMALEWDQVDLKARQLSVTQSEWKGEVTVPKGGRIRHVPLTERLAQALQGLRHLRGRRVLLNRDGTSLTQKVVQVIVRRCGGRARVTGGVHTLRHTFCSHLAMRGAPARSIQELAGHQDLATTQRYMHLSPAALEAAIRLLDTAAIN